MFRLRSEIVTVSPSGRKGTDSLGGCGSGRGHMIHVYCIVHAIREDVFVVEAAQVTEMLEGNVIAPYKFRKVVCSEA